MSILRGRAPGIIDRKVREIGEEDRATVFHLASGDTDRIRFHRDDVERRLL
mgnify:CR=1 FL=1